MKRPDGRAPDELRPVRFVRGYLKHAHGSCLIDLGDTRVLCAATVTEGVSAWRRGKELGWSTLSCPLRPTPAPGVRPPQADRGAARTRYSVSSAALSGRWST